MQNGLENRRPGRKFWLLRQILQAQTPAAQQLALVKGFDSGDDSQQGGFACPVDPDDPDLVALVDGQ